MRTGEHYFAGYLNSLLNLVQFGIAELHEDVDEAHDDAILVALFNLRSQAENQSKDDKRSPVGAWAGRNGQGVFTVCPPHRYKPRDANWLTWSEAQQTRMTCLQRFAEVGTSSAKQARRMTLCEEVHTPRPVPLPRCTN